MKHALHPQKTIGLILNLYLVAMCLVLPLYMPEQYLALGEHKFMMYRILTLAALAPCVALMLFDDTGQRTTLFDVLLLAAALSQTISFVLSRERTVSLFGIDGWRDGYFTEITFLLLAYFYAHYFSPHKRLPVLLLAGSLLNFAGTIIQCVCFPDPIRCFFGTIGNANWYAGFLSVYVPVCVTFLLKHDKENRKETIFFGVALALSLAACICQQSLSICLSLSFLVVAVLCERLSVSKKEAVANTAAKLFSVLTNLIVPVCVLVMLIQIFYPFPENFGTYRGRIWAETRAFLKTFGAKELLFGTGQDLFYHVTLDNPDYSAFLEGLNPSLERITNAHAELLNMLFTNGLAGVCTFLAIVTASLRKALKMSKGEAGTAALCCILVTGSYLANHTVSFRQVLSTPFVYMLAGICLGLQSKNSTTYSSR